MTLNALINFLFSVGSLVSLLLGFVNNKMYYLVLPVIVLILVIVFFKKNIKDRIYHVTGW